MSILKNSTILIVGLLACIYSTNLKKFEPKN